MNDSISNTKPNLTASQPPARFSAEAKAAWDTIPETVRAEVSRLERELVAGIEKYRTAAERDAGLAPFHDMAGNSGKNLKDVVANYMGLESLLRTDTLRGLEVICQNVGVSLREMAEKVLDQNASALTKRESHTAERKQHATDPTTEMVTKFAASHPRFEELADDIVFFLDTGRADDLAEAYSLAERFSEDHTSESPC